MNISKLQAFFHHLTVNYPNCKRKHSDSFSVFPCFCVLKVEKISQNDRKTQKTTFKNIDSK